MGFFSNGTEGDRYEQRWCARCVHYDADMMDGGCPIMLLHLDWNSEQVAAANDRYHGREPRDQASEAKRQALSRLIPRSEDGCDNEQCRMFHEKPPPARSPLQLVHEDLREFILGGGR